MTVTLAAVDKKTGHAWVGADSCASDSFNHSTVKNQKVFNPVGRRDILIGCAGTFRLPNLLQYIPGVFPPENEIATSDIDMSYLVNEFTPVVRALTDDFEDDDVWELLIAVGDRIYRMQMDMSIIEPSDNADAIGIGGSVALGAFKVLDELEPDMPIQDRIAHALRVACDTCQGCAPPFIIRHVEDSVISVKPGKQRDHIGYEIVRHDEDIVSDKKKDKDKDKKDRKKKKRQ